MGSTSGKLSVSTTELLKEHIAKPRIRAVDMYGVHEFFDVVIH